VRSSSKVAGSRRAATEPYTDHEFFEEKARLRLDPIHGAGARAALYAYLDDLLRHKLADPGDSLLADLVAEQIAAGAVDVAELVSFAMVLLISGHDTTASCAWRWRTSISAASTSVPVTGS
jgi:cytochrome P450